MSVPIAIIYCAVLEDEIETFAKDLSHVIRLEKLPQGLHNEPDRLRSSLQAIVDDIEMNTPEVDSIVVGYGLCSRGTEGVVTKRCKFVVPRAHDCITLLLGSKERYAEYVKAHPGTYWYSPGWNRHHIAPGKQRYETLRAQYAERFGEEDADFLMEEEQHWFSTYDRATFVDLRVIPSESDQEYTQECATWLGWNYDRQVGDPSLMQALVSGVWPADQFLVLEPGETLRMTANEQVIEAHHAS
jgi:hypothetical protein